MDFSSQSSTGKCCVMWHSHRSDAGQEDLNLQLQCDSTLWQLGRPVDLSAQLAWENTVTLQYCSCEKHSEAFISLCHVTRIFKLMCLGKDFLRPCDLGNSLDSRMVTAGHAPCQMVPPDN